ncbi:hypothetical protein OO185_02555 [Prosthecochloris sp. SCSIO W1102]|uniref:hypothetical protein n=1 Tax=Prosthecochloris sp. SCSIO W1102 TaxID=2992243 RepID=UPI00223CA400|nr:hypothetical protein [Prosthecochloris sp. SCSIO W1102]UZJ40002.1 hypothetical protein OO185_02555 [Prosthecochloris sp. SCSIO W1102]
MNSIISQILTALFTALVKIFRDGKLFGGSVIKAAPNNKDDDKFIENALRDGWGHDDNKLQRNEKSC